LRRTSVIASLVPLTGMIGAGFLALLLKVVQGPQDGQIGAEET
jgi:hypothetical protein